MLLWTCVEGFSSHSWIILLLLLLWFCLGKSFLRYSGGQVDAIWSDSLIEDGDDDDNDDSGNDIDYEEVVEIVSEVMRI